MINILRLFQKSQKLVSDIQNSLTTNEDVIDFCYIWNIRYPLDRWWREKHKIAFGSEAHRRVSFLDIRFEYEEDLIIKKVKEKNDYTPNIGDWFYIDQDIDNLTEEQKFKKFKKEFESFDLSEYDDNQ